MPEMLMPKLSDTMEEGTVLRWFKADGDQVAKGEPLVEIETDKATMTVEAPNDGTLAIIAQEGDTLDVGAPIAMIGDGPAAPSEGTVTTGIPTADDGTADTITAAAPTAPPAASPQAPPPPPPTAPAAAPPVTATGDRIAASPLARNIAAHHGIDLATLTGTGPGGRIVKHDVEAAIGAPTGVEPPGSRSPEISSTTDGPAAPIGAGVSASAPPSTPSTPTPLGGGAPSQPVPPKLPAPTPREDWPAGRRTPLTRLQQTISRRMTDAHAVPDKDTGIVRALSVLSAAAPLLTPPLLRRTFTTRSGPSPAWTRARCWTASRTASSRAPRCRKPPAPSANTCGAPRAPGPSFALRRAVFETARSVPRPRRAQVHGGG